MAPQRITVYADFIDPFCYIGFHNARRFARSAGIALAWQGFELNPDTPFEGSLLQTASNSDLQPGMWASVREFAKKSGLILAEPSYVPNTRLAHVWVQSVQQRDVKNNLIERIYQAYFSDKKNIGDPPILEELANEFGLPVKEIHSLAAERDPTRLENVRKEAMRRGFAGMPGFVYRDKTYFGALSEDAWNNIVKEKTVCSTK